MESLFIQTKLCGHIENDFILNQLFYEYITRVVYYFTYSCRPPDCVLKEKRLNKMLGSTNPNVFYLISMDESLILSKTSSYDLIFYPFFR